MGKRVLATRNSWDCREERRFVWFLLMMEMWKWVVTEISECGDIGTLGSANLKLLQASEALDKVGEG